MPIKSDYHMHSHFSGDSKTPMNAMIQRGIELKLENICFTEHMDFEYPPILGHEDMSFEVNTDSYLYEVLQMKEKYRDEINVLFGVELGLQPNLAKKNAAYIKSYDFDFVIGSSHLLNGLDVCDPLIYKNKLQEQVYEDYFLSIIENIKAFSNFDIYGHLDYIVRYGPKKDEGYTYEKYRDIFDEILKLLIEKGKGIEINTAGLNKGLKNLHPLPQVIKRYHQLGGEIITIGSDAHVPINMCQYFQNATDILLESGFRYYTIFENRMPIMKAL